MGEIALKLRQVPLESVEPVASFAFIRLALGVIALAATLIFHPHHAGRLALVIGLVGIPWALAIMLLSRRRPRLALTPAVALGDLVILAVVQLVAPDSYAAVRFYAIFLIATHAHIHGEVRGIAIALAGIALLVPIAFVVTSPVSNRVLGFYETLFAVSALASALFLGRLRAAESTGRLRARDLSRRTIEAENEVRRRVAESIHDGPVQELVSLDMMLAATRHSIRRGDSERALETLEEARLLTERNVNALRDEIVGLGPYAFDELSLDAALEQCAPVWGRRYAIEVETELERIELPNEISGALFGIAQEAVVNAGRHSGASRVSVSVTAAGGEVRLRVLDNGEGFHGASPLGPREPGHIGLASMRERAELIDGRLSIESTGRGTLVTATVPLPTSDESERGAAGSSSAPR